jgi:hypothetical protein
MMAWSRNKPQVPAPPAEFSLPGAKVCKCERFRMPAAHGRCREPRRPAYENPMDEIAGRGTWRCGARYRELRAGHNFEAG